MNKLRKVVDVVKRAGRKIPDPLIDLISSVAPPAGMILNALKGVEESKDLTSTDKIDITEVLQAMLKEQELQTDRHKTDMMSDSWLSKNFRPIAGFFVLAMTGFITVVSGYVSESPAWYFAQEVQNHWTNLSMAVITTYFTLRGVGHVFRINNTK